MEYVLVGDSLGVHGVDVNYKNMQRGSGLDSSSPGQGRWTEF
jgi:hypothetical protein